MKVLFDTNVVLDVLLAREPHAEAATRLFMLVDKGSIQASICATTVTTIHYLAMKSVGKAHAQKHLEVLLEMFDVASVDREVLARALKLDFADFEDAVLHEAAVLAGVSAIVTRNGKDFTRATLPVFAPQELLAAVGAASALGTISAAHCAVPAHLQTHPPFDFFPPAG